MDRYTADGKQTPIGNGGVGPGYWWTQTISDVTVHIAFSADVTSRDVTCKVEANRISIALKGRSQPVITGPLSGVVKHHDAIWNLESRAEAQRQRPVDITHPEKAKAPAGCGAVDPPNLSQHGAGVDTHFKVFTLTLDKVVETWWRSIIAGQGHPEIDATAVDSTMPVSSYDDETQATIRKIMYEQSQKAHGLPTSEEGQVQAMLERARAASGSPFLPGGSLEGTEIRTLVAQHASGAGTGSGGGAAGSHPIPHGYDHPDGETAPDIEKNDKD